MLTFFMVLISGFFSRGTLRGWKAAFSNTANHEKQQNDL